MRVNHVFDNREKEWGEGRQFQLSVRKNFLTTEKPVTGSCLQGGDPLTGLAVVGVAKGRWDWMTSLLTP